MSRLAATHSLPISRGGLVDELCDRFEAEWRADRPPKIEEFLNELASSGKGGDESSRLLLLMELIRIDLEYRWRSSARVAPPGHVLDCNQRAGGTMSLSEIPFPETPFIEDYAQHFPEIGDTAGLPLELIGEEYRARLRSGVRPTHAEYVDRFAARQRELSDLLSAIDHDCAPPPVGADKAAGTDTFAGSTVDPTGAKSFPPDLTVSYVRARLDGTDSLIVDQRDYEEISGHFFPGVVLNERYQLERELGRGGMGQVFFARDTRLGRPVAIKVLLSDASEHESSPELALRARIRFIDEARIGANLNHSAIATVFDFGFHEGKPFAVFEYIEGETLREALRRRGRIPLDEMLLLIAPLAQALDFAHNAGIVHRDLKPENIRATKQGHFKILDLGLAKDFRRATNWVGFEGTPAYASPEQAAGVASDGRTDQYALALICYEMLTGRRVFEHSDPRVLLQLHRAHEPPSVRTLAPDLPDAACTALTRALAKDPNQRFGNCEEFAIALGCRVLSTPVDSLTVLREGWAQSQPPGSNIAIDLLSYIDIMAAASKALRSVSVYLVLTPNALWCCKAGEVRSWPLRNLEVGHAAGKSSLEIKVKVETLSSMSFRFGGRHASTAAQEWHFDIRNAQQLQEDTGPEPSITARSNPTILRRPPSVRYQVLGTAEGKDSLQWRAEVALSTKAAMLGGDAVTKVERERISDLDGKTWRVSGTVVRVVDEQGKGEFEARRLSAEVRTLAAWMLGIVFLGLIGEALVLPFKFLHGINDPSRLALALMQNLLWPVALSLWLLTTRSPQLLKAAALTCLALVLTAVVQLATEIVCHWGDSDLRDVYVFFSKKPGHTVALAVLIFELAWLFYAGVFASEAWRTYGAFRSAMRGPQPRLKLTARLVHYLAMAMTVAFLVYASAQIFRDHSRAVDVTSSKETSAKGATDPVDPDVNEPVLSEDILRKFKESLKNMDR